ncbi:ROK family protein [Agromyces sp. NPDC058104]|uniref:ROK family transcriptional regulator n=1 Tax=Agromyces sp. NPDC058104 TaxID=3346342 RepID=UPI0036D98F80
MNRIDPGTPTWLRAHNDRTAFRLLLEHGPLTRAQLGELSGMSKPTAAQMITRLERVELIHAVGEVSGGRGPNAVSYGVRTDRLTGVAISVLADTIEAVVVDASDAPHPVVETPTAASGRTPEGDVSGAIEAACRAAGVPVETVGLAAIGVQAAFDADGDELSFTDTLPGWPQQGSRARLEAALGHTVLIENDVNLAAMAERAGGVATDVASFVLFWMGDGLGVGIDLGGAVHRGATGGAGEIGYLEVARGAESIAPDAHDLTDLLGGPAVARMLGAAPGTRLADALPGLAADPVALARLADRAVIAIAPLLAVIDPAMVVLGGPTAREGGTALEELVAARIDSAAHPRLVVRTSGTDDHPVLLGARQLLVDRIRDRLEDAITTAA